MNDKRKRGIVVAALCIVAFLFLAYRLYGIGSKRVTVNVPPREASQSEARLEGVSLAAPEIRTDLAPARDEKSEEPPGHLTVFVYDDTGVPAAGAKVTLRYSKSSDSDVEAGATFERVTDANGTAVFADMVWGWAWLLAERGEARSEQFRMAFRTKEYSKEIVLVLHRTDKIIGKVVNDEELPIPGARVVVSDRDQSTIPRAEEYPDAQTTGAEGRFAFSNLIEGVYRFRAVAESYAPGESEAVMTDGGREAKVRLALGSTKSGTVHSATTGAAVAEFSLVLWRKDLLDRAKTVETDSAGAFEFTGLMEGAYELSSGHETMIVTDGVVDVEVPRATPVSGLELLAQDGVTVSGRVLLEETEEPVAGVKVVSTHLTHLQLQHSSAPTDSDGKYVLAGMPPGVNNLAVQSNDSYRSPRLTLNVPAGGAVEKFDIHVPAAVTVEGVVLDEQGLPVAGASIRSRAWNMGIRQERSGHGLTDQDGSFLLAGISCPPGYDLMLQAYSNRGASEVTGPFAIPEDGLRGVVLRLIDKPLGSIAGHVVNTDGAPVFAWVSADPANQSDTAYQDGDWRRNGFSRTDVNGAFVIMSLPEDDYDLSVVEYIPNSSEPIDKKAGHVTLRAGQRMTGVELVLDAGAGDITGTVTDEKGRPVSGAYVGAQVDVDSQEFECMSDQSGKFRVPNLQDGLYMVKVVVQGYESQRLRGVAPGEEVNFVLVPVKDEKP